MFLHLGEKKIALVFCGVGTSWKGMCNSLMKIDVFRTAIKEVDRYLHKGSTGRYQTHLENQVILP
jgi:acyl transferase domain-containing protein